MGEEVRCDQRGLGWISASTGEQQTSQWDGWAKCIVLLPLRI